jgi:hypothetical protein
MKEIKYTILYCVCENFCDTILLRFRFSYGKTLRFLRFWFRNTEYNRSRSSWKSEKIMVSTEQKRKGIALNMCCHLNIHHHQAVAGSLEGEVAECLNNSYFQTVMTEKIPEIKTGIDIWYRFMTKTKQFSDSGVFRKL